ncbi:MAG: efflux RND transporter permease subunit, partial [Bacteroides sp.]
GRDGEYIPLTYAKVSQPEQIIKQTQGVVQKDKNWEVKFAGAHFTNLKMIGELIVVLLVSMLLMYFILASQFESFLQPLIVLIEIPIDIGFALVVLLLTGNTLNLMSAIGLIVVTGVVINDSILKLDMINELRKAGVELMEAIHTAGIRRLRAIVMTSLTTICAMIPILFSFDFGSELQKPLAIAMISTMLIGMAVSLFLVPLVYWAIYRKSNRNSVKHVEAKTDMP